MISAFSDERVDYFILAAVARLMEFSRCLSFTLKISINQLSHFFSILWIIIVTCKVDWAALFIYVHREWRVEFFLSLFWLNKRFFRSLLKKILWSYWFYSSLIFSCFKLRHNDFQSFSGKIFLYLYVKHFLLFLNKIY